MKTSFLAALAVLTTDFTFATKFISAPEGWPEAVGFNTTDYESAGITRPKRVARGAAPKRQVLTNRNAHIPGAKTVKIRYGPYTVPGARVPGGEGMINNRPAPSVEKPCQSCMILGMNAGLEYPEGADANTNTKMWLHHMVMFNIGKGANDATCSVFGAPHLIVGSSPGSSERIFSSGNERTTTFFNPPWANVTNLGYPLYPADRFGIIVDLMNMNDAPKEVYLTIYYDFVEGHPDNFEEVKPVWFDAMQCGTSELSGRGPTSKFDFASRPWIANFEGEVLGTGGHLHDGGTKVDIVVDDKVICTSVPTYGTDEEAMAKAEIAKAGGMGTAVPRQKMISRSAQEPVAPMAPMAPAAPAAGHAGHAGGKHIIAMSICADNKVEVKDIPLSPLGLKDLKKGQSWVLKAYYDYTKFPGMKSNSGGMSTVMGISIMYAKTKSKRVAIAAPPVVPQAPRNGTGPAETPKAPSAPAAPAPPRPQRPRPQRPGMGGTQVQSAQPQSPPVATPLSPPVTAPLVQSP